jgi:murein DD-endopeptidase MepM/ murein hydrolase activator NlpD
MKIRIILLLLSLSSISAYAQSEIKTDQQVIAAFQRLFNDGKYDSIAASFAPETKVNMPPEKTIAFLTQLSKRLGRIKKSIFERYDFGFAQYKAEMDLGDVTLALASNGKGEITGLFAKPYQVPVIKMPRNLTPMSLPFKGKWTVFWGGDTKEQNYHVVVNFQKNAFDLVVNGENGKSFKTDGKNNEDYYAFGQQILSPCAGEVVMAVDGVKDNVPGKMNTMYVPGNAILIKTANNEYILLAHFKQNTIKVKTGDKVQKGQLLGLCGNSGNSSEPHLHFNLQDDEDFGKAVGIKCFFDKITVNGELKRDYSPVKNDQISQ